MGARDDEGLSALTSLSVQGFRCFEQLAVRPLKTINVIVGRNNAGKTCLLEAIEVLLDGEPSSLVRIAKRREEVELETDGKFSSPVVRPMVGYAFHRATGSGRTFEIVGQTDEEGTQEGIHGIHPRIVRATLDDGFESILRWRIGLTNSRHAFDLIDVKSTPLARRPVLFVGSERPSGVSSASLWGRLSGSNAEESVIKVLRIIEPRVKRIGLGYQPPDVFLGLENEDSRHPLGHFGEGIGRLFSLAAHLALSAGRTLLVDDIDTGLHVSTMKKMWEVVFASAHELDVQLFATTHSDDCLRGLAAALADHPEFHSMVALHRVDRGATATTHYDAEEIVRSADASLEVRG